MAPETTRPVLMANVVCIGLPGHLHVVKNVPIVNIANGLNNVVQILPAALVNSRILLFIETQDGLLHALVGRDAIWVLLDQSFNRYFLNPWQVTGDSFGGHKGVDSQGWCPENMGRPVVAANTVQ